MIRVDDLEAQARGRWYGILTSLGVPESYLTGKHGPCLFCSGEDRWRWDNKDGSGTYICGQCGAGTAFQLIMKHLGINFKEALSRINEALGGGCKMDKVQNNQMDNSKIKAMLNKIWTGSIPLSGSDPVSKYLHSRKLVLQPDNVRYCPECYESDTKQNHPAMVAKVFNSKGVPVALHRTYLDRDKPQKADVPSPKKLTPALELLSGCAIRLFEIKGEKLGIAEGIETAISCSQMFDMPVWACVSSTILEGFEPPDGVRHIVIMADNDANYAGAKSAYVLANKLYNKEYIVEVKIPGCSGDDFNDIL